MNAFLKRRLSGEWPYGRKRWTALSRFLDKGVAEIDNNIAERAMRSLATLDSLCTPFLSI